MFKGSLTAFEMTHNENVRNEIELDLK